MNTKLIFAKSAFALVLIYITPAHSQTYPTLPKNWTGSVAIASIGSTSKLRQDYKTNSGKTWSTIEEPRTLRITQQSGRFLEMKLSTPRDKDAKVWAGVISQDGQKLYVTSPTATITFDIKEGNKLSGCGSVRGDNGTYEHWHNNYGSICFDFTAAK